MKNTCWPRGPALTSLPAMFPLKDKLLSVAMTFVDTHRESIATTRFTPCRQSIAGIFINVGVWLLLPELPLLLQRHLIFPRVNSCPVQVRDCVSECFPQKKLISVLITV